MTFNALNICFSAETGAYIFLSPPLFLGIVKVVVKLFKSKKLTIKEAIRDMRLVNMHQLDIDGETINLWNPPCDLENTK